MRKAVAPILFGLLAAALRGDREAQWRCDHGPPGRESA